MASKDHTIAELRRAYRDCALVNMTFDQAMNHKTLAIAIRLKADSNRRRAAREAQKQLRFDAKRAQANDTD
ncbi:hypothetical protein ASC94_09115 [Massilia sp. Root418]|uniref:hypothetical protein n=1 Tax=Massilia sp. Root418 TaxID=1736532 RepID=UPI000700FF87|nr:hypothetical protein [Massilia sp. Root418]KQW96957.1 hypothetical protein ASC94_09115 [Massilia sp. Root418]